jgi:BirA family biotin operon repressor/biotin-[acetyl-CoA-carboxylase] ligase
VIGTNVVVLPKAASTMSELRARLAQGDAPDAVVALDQTSGRGRLGRVWHSEPGKSLTMSVAVLQCPDHPAPWLLGMAVALAVAEAFDAKVRWPNDVHYPEGKIAGILTEIWPDGQGRKTAVVGIGVNLEEMDWPQGSKPAAIRQSHGPLEAAERVMHALRATEPPMQWPDLEPRWRGLDDTPGKRYRLPTGEEVTAVHVGDGGALIAEGSAGRIRVLAAEAILAGP